MATNQELIELLELDLGLSNINRRPYAKEIFKWIDIDLLPHSSEDTLLCEIFEWNGRNWRTTEKNLIGYIFNDAEIQLIKKKLLEIPKYYASVPDFEFTKEQMIELGAGIPALFNIKFTGNVKNAKKLSVKVNDVVKSRITNIDSPGIEIMRALSEFSQKKSKAYRRDIKSNFITKSLFYADSVEIYLEKNAGVDIGISFDVEGVNVETRVDTDTEKEFKLSYSGKKAPFGASFVRGKDFY